MRVWGSDIDLAIDRKKYFAIMKVIYNGLNNNKKKFLKTHNQTLLKQKEHHAKLHSCQYMRTRTFSFNQFISKKLA